ncbi:hypothetical protein [Desulfosarcina cetonica]|uniref:hypothetical protein n=1 Tax=Desulfosarcina cetonica TaxID=90730 RepID=UPI0012ECD861|nr:hypothetical protein [Desulfosarcina cetonica]
MNVDVKYIECEMPKVSRKGLTPKAYSEKVKAVRSEVESRHKVIVNIDLEASPHFEYTINGLVIPMERIRQLKDLEMKRFELQLDCLKAMRDEGKQEQAMQLATAMISGRRW